jgi:hypothetical protein
MVNFSWFYICHCLNYIMYVMLYFVNDLTYTYFGIGYILYLTAFKRTLELIAIWSHVVRFYDTNP